MVDGKWKRAADYWRFTIFHVPFAIQEMRFSAVLLEPALENVPDDGDLALDGQRGIRVGLRLSESAVTPKLDGLDLPDEVRQRIYYGSVAGDARGCHRPAGHGHGFHGYRGSPRSAPDRTAGLPAAAVGLPSRAQRGREARCCRVEPC
jgi:hypothetical protein